MDQLQRVHFVVKRYPHLQGLRLLPIGLVFVASGLWQAGYFRWWPGAADAAGQWWFAGAFVVALVAAVALGRYYRARFGSVDPLPNVPAFLSAVGFGAMVVGAVWLQTALDSPISVPLLFVAAALMFVGLTGGYVRVHYVVVGTACLLLATMGVFGVPLQTRLVLLDYVIGGGLIAVGIGDHLLLRNTLEPYPHVRTV